MIDVQEYYQPHEPYRTKRSGGAFHAQPIDQIASSESTLEGACFRSAWRTRRRHNAEGGGTQRATDGEFQEVVGELVQRLAKPPVATGATEFRRSGFTWFTVWKVSNCSYTDFCRRNSGCVFIT